MSIQFQICKIVTLVIIGLLFFGCSTQNNSGEEEVTDMGNTKLSMIVGEPVTVSVGQKLVPEDDDTVIEVVHNIEENKKSVTLISGRATLSNVVNDN